MNEEYIKIFMWIATLFAVLVIFAVTKFLIFATGLVLGLVIGFLYSKNLTAHALFRKRGS